jgi:hypothetical protein
MTDMNDSASKSLGRNRIKTAVFVDSEMLAGGLLLAAVLIVGLVTASDYGITTDEFFFDPYGPKALAWYSSGFTNGSLFEYYDAYLYGPWFQILVAVAQSFHIAKPFVVRHALSFVVGLSGIAALLPVGRLAVGPWAGFAAVVLCLTTGNLYGHLFFTPNDIPFLAAMTWATLAIVVMSSSTIPTWRATIAAGLATGLAISTRFGGILSQLYLIGAMVMCALSLIPARDRRKGSLIAISVRTLSALMIGWVTAIAMWPWLLGSDPVVRFLEVYRYFIRSYVQFEFEAWGQKLTSGALPWHYIAGQLVARLPEGFVALLFIAVVFGVVALGRFFWKCGVGIKQNGLGGLLTSVSELAQWRGVLIVAAAALGPPIFVVARGSVVFDGLRHLLFILPMLALLAAWALLRIAPLLLRMPTYAAGLVALHLITTVSVMVYLHPLEYIAMNGFAGGTAGAYGRFDLDYWSAAATEAVRRLERRLARNPSAEFAMRQPRVMVCIGFRESMVAPIFSRPWIVATEPTEADFVIVTERSKCARDVRGTVIDSVERFGRTFAATIEMPGYESRAGQPPEQ